jgi:hypothetical protein
MTSLELFDETLDINSTENYELSVQAGPDGFSFCLLDILRNKFVLLRSYEPDESKYFNASGIRELISKDDFLTKKYRKVRIVMPSPRFTLVPSALFDPASKNEFFSLNHRIEEGRSILLNKAEDPDVYIVFSVIKNIHDVLEEYYPAVHPYVHLKSLFTHIAGSAKSMTGNYIHLHVERDYFNLIIFRDNQLKFCNTFNYRSVPDIMYFVFNVFSKLGLKQEETINISGIKQKNHEMTASLRDYVSSVKFAVPKGNFTFSYVFGDIEVHRYLNLFNIVNCE